MSPRATFKGANSARSRFVSVPAHALRSRLIAAGFELLPGAGEEVYERRHARHRDFAVKVYTSIARGKSEARGCGEDAIRVCVVRYFAWHGGMAREQSERDARGLQSEARVYRTGTVEGVLDRMIERARDAYGFINETLKKQREEVTMTAPAKPVCPACAIDDKPPPKPCDAYLIADAAMPVEPPPRSA